MHMPHFPGQGRARKVELASTGESPKCSGMHHFVSLGIQSFFLAMFSVVEPNKIFLFLSNNIPDRLGTIL